MKKTLNSFLLFAISYLLFAAPAVSAKSARAQGAFAEITISHLRVDEPAIIASNPFYRPIEFFRTVGDSFATGRIEKISSRLESLSLKAAQVLKIRSVAPGNAKLQMKALSEYQWAVYQYAVALQQLTSADLNRAGTLDTELALATLTHVRLIDELLANSITSSQRAALMDIGDRFTAASVRLFAEHDSLLAASEALGFHEDDQWETIRNAEAFSALAKHAAATDANDLAQDLLAVRGKLLDQISEAALADSFTGFASLAGNQAEHLQTISYLLGNTDLNSTPELVAVRDQLLIQVFSR